MIVAVSTLEDRAPVSSTPVGSQQRSFQVFGANGFGPLLQPAGKHGGKIASGSSLKPETLAKVPAIKKSDGLWWGLTGWTTRPPSTEADHRSYDDMGANTSLRTGEVPGVPDLAIGALDVDANDPRIAAAIIDCAQDYLGLSPRRTRAGSPRAILLYRLIDGAGKRKTMRVTFRPPAQSADTKHLIEFLLHGRQCIVDGVHPGGARYEWPDGYPVADELPEIDDALIDRFWAAARALLVRLGCVIEREAGPAAASGGAHKSLDDPSMWCPHGPERVIRQLQLIDPCSIGARNDLVGLYAAVKAALGPAREDYCADVLDWHMQFPGAEEDYFNHIWESIHDAQLGWPWFEHYGPGAHLAAQEDFADPPTDEQTPPDPAEAALLCMLTENVWVADLACYNHLPTGGFRSGRQVNAAHVDVAPYGATGRQTAEALFQNDPRAQKVATATCRPGDPKITVDENERGIRVPAVNLWRPSRVRPSSGVTAEDVAPWLEHMTLLFGPEGAAEREHFLNFVAFILQKPGRKIGHALVMIGGQGVGKDTVLQPIFEAVGLHNVASVDTATLTGQWTYFLKAQIIYGQEIITNGRRDQYNHLKPFISGQKSRLAVNEKGLRQYFVPNQQNWIISSNHDNALALEDDDRRFWVHRVLPDEPPSEEYFAKLHAWLENGGTESVFGWLLQRDLSAFNPMARPPMTAAKRTMLDLSQPAPVRWLRGQFAEGEPFANRTVVVARELMTAAKQSWGAPVDVNEKQAVSALKAEGFSKAGRVRIGADTLTLWVRDVSGLLGQLSLDKLREHYLAELAAAKKSGAAA